MRIFNAVGPRVQRGVAMAGTTVGDDSVYEFGRFSLDARQGTLTSHGESVPLRPKAYLLLLYLAKSNGRVVPKSELLDAVWPNVYVTEDSLTQAIREIRKVLSDTNQELVRTITRRGYMLSVKSDDDIGGPAQPILAVLRFRNEGGDETTVDGFADDIINGIARFDRVTVLARNSTFSFGSPESAQLSDTASRIGADYLVEGSVRRVGNRAFISVNLIDAASSAQLWGERYQAEDVELFSVQEEICIQIISRLVAQLDEVTLRRASVKPTSDLAAYELVAKGAAAFRSYRFADVMQSQKYFEQAIARDPNYGLAHGYLALIRVVVNGLPYGKREVFEDALQIAKRGVSLAPEQSMGHRAMAMALLCLGQHAAAEAALRRSFNINRYDADALAQMGYLQTLRGRPADGLAWHQRAVSLNPIHPYWYDHDRSFALYHLGEYAEAAVALETCPVVPPLVRTGLAACYAQLGDLESARRNMLLVEQSDLPFSPSEYVAGLPFEHAADRDHFAEGVSKALSSI